MTRDKKVNPATPQNISRLLEINDRLSSEIADIKKQLIHSGKLASLGEIAAGVAHELNQPLAIIRARAELLRMKSREEPVPMDELQAELSEILDKVDMAVLLIEQMRGFSRSGEDFIEHIDITEPVDRALIYFREQFRLHQIEFSQDIQNNLPEIRANSQHIEQIIINLLSNARYAVDKRKEQTDTSFRKQIALTLSLQDQLSVIQLSVADNGVGMNEEDQARCLNPFFTTKSEGDGTGLGLSIINGLIRDLGGELSITSKPNEGTVITVSIPVGK